MFKLYGKRNKCVWCGKVCQGDFKEIEISVKSSKDKAIVCSEDCGNLTFDTCRFIERNIKFFWIGIIFTFIVTGFSIFAPLSLKKYLLSIELLILGLTVTILPFVTPQTVKMVGLKNGMIIGRITGILVLIMGIWFLVKW